MKLRDKIVTQAVICMMIFAVIKTVGLIDAEPINKVKSAVSSYYQKNYTLEDIKDVGSKAVKEAKDINTAVTAAVVKANQLTEENPLGKADKNGLQVVYAAEKGTVTQAGIDKEIGSFIKIKSSDSIYTYGNLSELSAVTGDKVKKGDVIGEFNSKEGAEFYYQRT